MKKLFFHVKQFMFRGLLTLIPVGLTIFTIRIVYVFIDKRVTEVIARYTGHHIPGLGLLLFIIVLYLTGLVASNMVGRKMISVIDRISTRIPIIKMTYLVGKQLSNTLSLPEKHIFKKAVLVDFFKPGVWVTGFITGEVTDAKSGEVYVKVFIPTVPNPTSGFLAIMKESQVVDPHWTVEEAMKMTISGGIIGPERIGMTGE